MQLEMVTPFWKDDALHVRKPSDWPGIVAARVQSAMDTACHVTDLHHCAASHERICCYTPIAGTQVHWHQRSREQLPRSHCHGLSLEAPSRAKRGTTFLTGSFCTLKSSTFLSRFQVFKPLPGMEPNLCMTEFSPSHIAS